MEGYSVFTKSLLDKAIDLHVTHKVKWQDIAERLGVKTNSLKVAVCRYKAGNMKFKREEFLERWKALEQMVQEGLNVHQMSVRLQCDKTAINLTLRNMGYDPEVRREIAPYKRKRKGE